MDKASRPEGGCTPLRIRLKRRKKMAIAGIVVTGVAGDGAIVRRVLEAAPGISRVQTTDNVAKLVAVLECAANDLEKELERLKVAEGILNVDLVYVNYEEEVEAGAC